MTIISIDGNGNNLLRTADFIFTQTQASEVWNITHNLGKYPSVTAVEGSDIATGNIIVGEVKYIDADNLTITFSAAVSGFAMLN